VHKPWATLGHGLAIYVGKMPRMQYAQFSKDPPQRDMDD